MFPKFIHQIWLQGEECLPFKYRQWSEEWGQMNPDWIRCIWDSDSILALIKEDYPYLWNAWRKLDLQNSGRNYAKKSDFARCLIIHKFGGLYIDTDTEPLKPIDYFIEEGRVYLKDKRELKRMPVGNQMFYSKEDFSEYDFMLSADNFCIKDNLSSVTNAHILSKANVDFWLEFIISRLVFMDEPTLKAFGTWALTDFLRFNKMEDRTKALILSPYQWNWIPKQMEEMAPEFTVCLHHNDMTWAPKESGGFLKV